MRVKVFDKTLKAEREVELKAAKILHKRYDILSYIDADGNETEAPAPVVVQKKSQAKSVEPVEVKPQITVLKQIKTPEEITAKKAELEALNHEAIQKATAEYAESQEIKERKKPGPKPKINA
jgi:hypothetical protein